MRLSFISTVCALYALTGAKNIFDVNDLVEDIEKRGAQDPLFQEPPTHNDFYVPKGEEPQRGPTLLTSGINVNREISVFAGYVRDNLAIAGRFNNVRKQTVVFAPTDDGIQALSLKPWQFPTPVDDTKSEEEINSIIESNVQSFIESHLVDGEVPFEVLNSDRSNLGALLVTENGRKVKLVNDDGEYYVSAEFNGKDGEWLKVHSVTTVDNGAILIIDKPLSFPNFS